MQYASITYICFTYSFYVPGKKRLGSVIYDLGIPISRAFSTTCEPTCSYSYYTIVSSDVSFKLHGLCVYVWASDVRVDVECVCECEGTDERTSDSDWGR